MARHQPSGAHLRPADCGPPPALVQRDGQGASRERLAVAPAQGTSPTITIALPLDALPAVTVAAPPPALVTKRNAAYLGMTGPELVRVLRAMRADPRFRDAVVVHGKSYRAAPPEAIIAYLRAAPLVAADEDTGADDLLHELGYERTGPGPGRGHRGGKG